jgi:hypothetical protein
VRSFGVPSIGFWHALTAASLVDHSAEALEKAFRATLKHFAKAVAMSQHIHTHLELRQQIHDDLRMQHPEWVEPNGESPMCDSYEARLTELLDTLTRTEFTARFKINDSATEAAADNDPRSSRAKEASQYRAAPLTQRKKYGTNYHTKWRPGRGAT